MVAADVTKSQADLQSAAARVEQAQRALRTGIATFNGNFEGLQQTTRFGDVLVLVTAKTPPELASGFIGAVARSDSPDVGPALGALRKDGWKLALLTNWVAIRLRRLPIGRAWEALREDEIACRSLGINTTTTKLTAFATGAMFAGFAGAFFATRQGFISPESFSFQESALVLAILTIVGYSISDTIVIFRVNQTSGKLTPTGETISVASPVTIAFR